MAAVQPAILVTEVTDPEQLAQAQGRRDRYARNVQWLRDHATLAGASLRRGYGRGALAHAREAHPEDDGRYLRYVPRERVARIYAYSRRLASV